MDDKKLNTLTVAVLFVGAIMGAGFASGRETWQFFGVFGKEGIIGVVIFSIMFMFIGHVIRYNAKVLNTTDMGKLIVPGGNKKIESFVGYFMALILATVLVTMTAAAGSLLNQQFGLNYYVGGLLLTVLVIATVLGDFERISKVFKYIMPALCVAMILTCIVVISSTPRVYPDVVIEKSPVAPNWLFASFSYVAYNVLALFSIVAKSTLNSKSERVAVNGTTLGALFISVLAMLILITILIDPAFSQSLDMPVLGYANRLSPAVSYIYTAILFCAIYSTATSNFYGFTTKVKDGPNKKKIIVLAAFMAFLLGLVGFKNIIRYYSPLIGYVGLLIIGLLVINYFALLKKERHNG